MKGKQLLLVLVALIAIGGAALFLRNRNAASWSNTATGSNAKVADFALNDVAQIAIKGAGAELHLIKKQDVWTVRERADYPADFDKVSSLVRKIWELRPVQDVKVGPSQLGRLQLTEPGNDPQSGTLLEFKDAADKRLAALLLGKKQSRNADQGPAEGGAIPAGRYVMAQDNSNRVFVVSATLDEVQTKPEQWLSRDFIAIENPKSIAISGAGAANWTLVRGNASSPWKLADAKPGEEIDASKGSSLATVFAHGSFADVLAPDAPAAETGLDQPTTVRIQTFDNFNYELRIGKPAAENYPVLVSVSADLPKERTPPPDEKPEDKAKRDQEFQARQKQLTDKLAKEQTLEKRPYLIAKSTIESLFKDRASLLTQPSPSPSPGVVTSPVAAPGKAPVPAPPNAAAPTKPSARPQGSPPAAAKPNRP
jgi:hypothetical protein